MISGKFQLSDSNLPVSFIYSYVFGGFIFGLKKIIFHYYVIMYLNSICILFSYRRSGFLRSSFSVVCGDDSQSQVFVVGSAVCPVAHHEKQTIKITIGLLFSCREPKTSEP